MKITFIQEPELEFGVGRHVDIRFGIMNYGPLDHCEPTAPKQINLALIGNAQTTEGVQEWLAKCKEEIPAKESNQPALFPSFPGCAPDRGLHTAIQTPPTLVKAISRSEISGLAKHSDRNAVAEQSAGMFLSELRSISENSPSVDVIACALPMELLEAMDPPPGAGGEDAENAGAISGARVDFHDLLKAGAMQYGKPIQIILPMTYDNSIRRRQRRRSERTRQLQDEATRAWNIHTALYYKAGGVPWRLVRDSTHLTACYVGISFFRSLDGSSLLTSVAQVFNERGEGVIVRGGVAQLSKEDRQPHLSSEAASMLMAQALGKYREVHRTSPARVVVHKSSPYDEDELDGFTSGLKDERIEVSDLVSVGASSTRLCRSGVYPPLRGTFLSFSTEDHLLYTRGSVDFFQTYPGLYVPAPRRIRCACTEQTPRFLAQEILALTKMNWNNTQFDGALPITIRAARDVSDVLRYCKPSDRIEPRYSFYM